MTTIIQEMGLFVLSVKFEFTSFCPPCQKWIGCFLHQVKKAWDVLSYNQDYCFRIKLQSKYAYSFRQITVIKVIINKSFNLLVRKCDIDFMALNIGVSKPWSSSSRSSKFISMSYTMTKKRVTIYHLQKGGKDKV